MEKYGSIPEKIIDTHMHIEAWENDEYDFIDCFEGHRELSNLASLNICCLPTAQGTFCNNIMAGLYKLAHPNTYVHAGFDHIFWPITEDMPQGEDLVTQYKELMEIGFDGIKMIEGKPIVLKKIGNDLNHPALDRVYTEMEKDGTHVVFHMKDPESFWDKSKVEPELIEKGWFYGDGTYLTYEEIEKQAYTLLERHPNLKVTLAHLFFYGDCPEKLEALFEKYPNMCVDLTPGCEMYHSFEANHDYYKDFFKRHSKRILLGTDGTFPWSTKSHIWCIDVLYRFIATTDARVAFDDAILTGMKIEGEEKKDILYRNFERRVGEKPRQINKDALRAYIEKYKKYISDESMARLAPYIKKYLGE